MNNVLDINAEQLYEDALNYNDLCWDNPNSRKAAQEFEEDSNYELVGLGSNRSVFQNKELIGGGLVVKFPNRVYKPEEGNQENIDEYLAWETMEEGIKDDFAEVLDCGNDGNYLVQEKAEEGNLLESYLMVLKYELAGYPSEDLKPANIGIIEGEHVIVDFPWSDVG